MGKAKPNAYWTFVQHQRNVNPNISDAALGEMWRSMDENERSPFKSQADARKVGRNIPIHGQICSIPSTSVKTVDDEIRAEREREDYERYLTDVVEGCVNACKDREEFISASFFVMASNVLVKTDNGEYIPLEIGLIEFNIKNGIINEYHVFVDPGTVPSGYARMAKEHTEATHKIPYIDFAYSNNDYASIVDLMCEMLKNSQFVNITNSKMTPQLVFCNPEMIAQNRGVIKWLKDKYGDDINWEYEVLDFIKLLYFAAQKSGTNIPIALIETKMRSSIYDYSQGINCPEFHEEMDNMYCASGVAKKWIYYYLDTACSLFNVKLTEKHAPPKVENPVVDVYFPELKEVRPLRNNTSHDNDSLLAPIARPSSAPNTDCLAERDFRLPASAAAARACGNDSRPERLGIGRGSIRSYHGDRN